MNARVIKLMVVFATVFLLLPLLSSQSQGVISKLSVAQADEQPSCTDWNLAAEFRRYPNQENPNRDLCGNLGVWYFMESTGLSRDPQTYALLPYFANSSSSIQGLEKWTGLDYLPPPDGLPEFVINTTGVTQTAGYELPPNVVIAHPSEQRLAVAGWRSPVSGRVSITGAVKDLNPGCGDGIQWYIDQGAIGLAAGSIVNGGYQEFQDGTGGTSLAEVQVNQGDFVYFIIHPNGNLACDSTELDISIHLLSNLSITKRANLTSIRPGEQLTYTIALTNYGALAFADVRLTDTLPISLTYSANSLMATGGSYGYADGVITWTGTVDALGSVSVTYAAVISPALSLGVSIVNAAQITSDGEAITRSATISLPLAAVFLPFINKPQPGIYGHVTLNGFAAPGVFLELRFFNGSAWSTLASTVTGADGNYLFVNVPGLAGGQKYYVRFLNPSDVADGRLADWYTRVLTVYSAGSLVEIGNFDLADITLQSPSPGARVALPYTFRWTRRSATPADTYEFNLFDPSGTAFFYTIPPLGYVDSYTLGHLPGGFSPNKPYGWFIATYSPDGGYGESFYYRGVTFSNAGYLISDNLPEMNRTMRRDDFALPVFRQSMLVSRPGR